MYKTYRKLRFIHNTTPTNIKVGGAVLAGIIIPALVSITIRVAELGSRVEMYF